MKQAKRLSILTGDGTGTTDTNDITVDDDAYHAANTNAIKAFLLTHGATENASDSA